MTRPDPDMTQMRDLDTLLAQASRDSGPAPDAQFMTQMMQDALAHQPLPHRTAVRLSLWQQIRSVLGGWQGMGGLVAATFAGFWIGINPPDTVPSSVEGLLNMEFVYDVTEDDPDTFGFGWVLEEG